MKPYLLRSKATGLYRLIAPCDSREGSDDHEQWTDDPCEAAAVIGEDVPDRAWLAERGLELVPEFP